MNLKLFVLAVCLLTGSSFSQGSNDLGTNSYLNSTELPRAYALLESLIEEANDGAIIIVPSNTYVLNQSLCINKNITLVGSPFVRIDGCGTCQILRIDNPYANVTVEKILFMHGKGDNGSAITSCARSLTIKNCRFLDNLAYHGGGIYQIGGELKVINSTFEDNKAVHWGAAVFGEDGDIQLENSTFDHNFGRCIISIFGIRPDQTTVSIRGCNISNNLGFDGAEREVSVMLDCRHSTVLMDHCIINGNNATLNESDVCGSQNNLMFMGSNVTLNDTRIENNTAFFTIPVFINGCIVQMNRCNITGNRALSLVFNGEYLSEGAGVEITSDSDVSMNDVIIEGNTADYGEAGAIRNAGKLNLNKGTVITKNSARQYSALFNTNTGVVNISKDAVIIDNHDELQPSQTIHSEGVLNLDS